MTGVQRNEQEFGFKRTVCSCRMCRLLCEHEPGYLVPSDLTRLIPPEVESVRLGGRTFEGKSRIRRVFNRFWDRSVDPVSGAREEGLSGHCHWYEQGRCVVHDRSPFGCAYLDQHLTDREADRRNQTWEGGTQTSVRAAVTLRPGFGRTSGKRVWSLRPEPKITRGTLSAIPVHHRHGCHPILLRHRSTHNEH